MVLIRCSADARHVCTSESGHLHEAGLDLALEAGVALEALANAGVVVALTAAAALVVVEVSGLLLDDRGERAVRLEVDARELRRAAVAALGRLDHEEVLRAL